MREEDVHDRPLELVWRNEVDDVIDVDVRIAELRSFDVDRVGLNAIRELANGHRKRRRDQERSPSLGRVLEDRLEIFAKAHVEQAIGLVEDDDADGRSIERFAREMIEHATGRSDDHLRRRSERAKLVAVARATRERRDTRADVGVEPAELLLDLARELACRHDDERARERRRFGRRLDRGRKREADRDGLARAGLRGDPEILPDGRRFEDGPLHCRELAEPPALGRAREWRREPREVVFVHRGLVYQAPRTSGEESPQRLGLSRSRAEFSVTANGSSSRVGASIRAPMR